MAGSEGVGGELRFGREGSCLSLRSARKGEGLVARVPDMVGRVVHLCQG
jgi:hypothetical protein